MEANTLDAPPSAKVPLPLADWAKTRLHRSSALPWQDSVAGLVAQFLRSSPARPVWAVTALARDTGLSRSGVIKILYAMRRPSLDSGLKIARAMQISPWKVLDHCLAAYTARYKSDPRRDASKPTFYRPKRPKEEMGEARRIGAAHIKIRG